MATATKAKQAVEQAKAVLAGAITEQNAQRSRRKMLCGCGKMHMLNSMELLITHWYVQPRGCTEGDYWNEGGWQAVCPATGAINRLMFDDFSVDYKKRGVIGVAAEPTFKSIYRALFMSRRETHGDNPLDKTPRYNNDYIDQNRKRFELPEKPKKGT